MYWQVRFGASPLGPDRVMTCYKDASRDPMTGHDNALVTVRWRDQPVNQPESAVLGEMERGILPTGVSAPFIVVDSGNWVYKGIHVADGAAIPNIIGPEFDAEAASGQTPSGTTIVGNSPVVDYTGHHTVAQATVYITSSGAVVFDAGTIEWSHGLDNFLYDDGLGCLQGCPIRGTPDSRLQAVTANILARMRTGPALAMSEPGRTAGPS
jgi:hypothetical protein